METADLTPSTIIENEGRYAIDFVDNANSLHLTLFVTINLDDPSVIEGIEVED